MPIVVDDEEFTFTCTGEKTKRKYTGKFRAKKSLSMADHIDADRMFRDLLGGQNPSHAGPKAQNIAGLIAELHVRITKAPAWWTDEMQRGLAVKKDENILADLCNATMEIEAKALKAEQEEADADKEALRATKSDDDE